jgi:hypothetical protein
MAKKDLFKEETTLECPGLTFKSDVKPVSGSDFPEGTDEGKLLTLTQNGDDFVADYKGTLTIGNKRYDWESKEKSKVQPNGNVKGTEEVTFTTEAVPGFPKKIKMDTEWDKNTKKVTNSGYQE